jgi:hypothetical protein
MQSIPNARDQIGWRFWLQWTIVNTAGWSVGLPFGFAMVSRFGEVIGHALGPSSSDPSVALVGAMVGTSTIPVGIMQWIVLRGQLDQAGRWVLASTLGWIIGLALGWSASMALSETQADAVRSAVMGAVTGGVGGGASGTMQWLVMRDQGHQTGWWLLISIVGWGVAFAAAWSTAWLISGLADLIATYAVIGMIVGSLGGAFTGIALVWLLRRPTSESQLQRRPKSAFRN